MTVLNDKNHSCIQENLLRELAVNLAVVRTTCEQLTRSMQTLTQSTDSIRESVHGQGGVGLRERIARLEWIVSAALVVFMLVSTGFLQTAGQHLFRWMGGN